VPVKESPGRSSSLLAGAKPCVIGIEFNQVQITAILVDESARVVESLQLETPLRTTRAAIAALSKSILDLAASKQRGDSPIVAIGLSVAGLIDPPTGRVSVPGLTGWTRVALREMLEKSLSDSGHDIRLPLHQKRARAALAESSHPAISIHARASASAAAESWCGSARGKNNVVYLSVGAEIEAGLLADGRALVGAGGQAGAAGWLAVSEHFKAEYETNGCLSAEAAMKAMARRAIEEWDGKGSSMLGGLVKADASQLDAATILRAGRGGDKLAVKVINDTCRWLGRGVANLISILNPEVVVIGGEVGSALKPFLDSIREEARRWAAPNAARQCRIVGASVGEKASALGAARLALLRLR